MSGINPIATVFYPPARWLAWLPRLIWIPKYSVKLVRIGASRRLYLDQRSTTIEAVSIGNSVRYYQTR